MNKKSKILLSIFLILIFFLYLQILNSAFAINDSPEIMTAIFTSGICHPPGYPLFTMMGKVFLSIKTGGVAFNANLFSTFLGIIFLFLFYLILKNIEIKEELIYFGLFIFAFSYGFLKETIQVKGGIYVLNLIFMILLIYLLFSLFDSFDIKKLYLMFYIYFLSLANHWQTMIFFLPIVLYVLSCYLKNMKLKNYFFIIFLLFTGLSPYLFILIRAKSDIVLNHGIPDNFMNLLKHILRINYDGEFENFNFNIFLFQMKEFLFSFYESFNLFIFLFFIGVFYELKKKDKKLIILFLIFILNIFSVIIFFRRRQDSSCYYLPSIFVATIFIVYGIKNIYNLKNKIIKITLLFLFCIILFFTSFKNYFLLKSNRNFLSYDYINNIYKTIRYDAIYIASSDFDINPIFYMKNVLKKRQDIKIIFGNYLAFDWGIDQFKKDFPDFRENFILKNPFKNIKKIINYYANTNIYVSFNHDITKRIGLKYNQTGLLIYFGAYHGMIDYFKIYSLRGILNRNFQISGDNFRLISNYAGNMVNYGNEFLKAGKVSVAIKLFEKAIKMPFNGSKKGFYYNLSLAYLKAGDIENSLKFRKIAETLTE